MTTAIQYQPEPLSKADMNPPPYHLEPTISPLRSLYEDRKYSLRVETDVRQRMVDSGQFLTGTATVHCLKDVDEPVNLSLTIWNKITTFKSKHKFLGRKNTLHNSTMTKINRSIIPITQPMKAGYSYQWPFSIQFPDQDNLPTCECCGGQIHCASPPSCVDGNVHVEYHLTAIVRHQSKRCWQLFFYQPSNSNFDLSNFIDVQGKSLMRKHTSLRSPKISSSAWPVYHAPEQLGGYIRVDASSCERIRSVRTTIVQHTATNPEGFGNVVLKDGRQQTKKISSNTLIGNWAPGETQIDVPYELPTKSMLPSHISCYTAILYFFKIELQIDSEVSTLTVPLSISNESVPEYPDLVAPTPLKV